MFGVLPGQYSLEYDPDSQVDVVVTLGVDWITHDIPSANEGSLNPSLQAYILKNAIKLLTNRVWPCGRRSDIPDCIDMEKL